MFWLKIVIECVVDTQICSYIITSAFISFVGPNGLYILSQYLLTMACRLDSKYQ